MEKAEQFISLADLTQLEASIARAPKCRACGGSGYIEEHQPGHTHYETDAGEPCPIWHYKRVPCGCGRTALPALIAQHRRAMDVVEKQHGPLSGSNMTCYPCRWNALDPEMRNGPPTPCEAAEMIRAWKAQ